MDWIRDRVAIGSDISFGLAPENMIKIELVIDHYCTTFYLAIPLRGKYH